jgi:hypothetical protein
MFGERRLQHVGCPHVHMIWQHAQGHKLTPWNRVFLQKLIIPQHVKEFFCTLWKPKLHYRDFRIPPRCWWSLWSLGYYTASCGNYLPTFRDNVLVPSSRVKIPNRKESPPLVPEPDQSIPQPHHISWTSISILFSHVRLGLPSVFFSSSFPTKILCATRSLYYWQVLCWVISGYRRDITQRSLIVFYRCFGTTYRSHLEGCKQFLDAWRCDR